MTLKQLIEYIISNKGIDMCEGCGCPPDHKMIECDIATVNCEDCWEDFLRNRYKKFKG